MRATWTRDDLICRWCEGGGLASNGEDSCPRCGGSGRDEGGFLTEQIVGHMPASVRLWNEWTLREAIRWGLDRLEEARERVE